jgi:hypothetical protein
VSGGGAGVSPALTQAKASAIKKTGGLQNAYSLSEQLAMTTKPPGVNTAFTAHLLLT